MNRIACIVATLFGMALMCFVGCSDSGSDPGVRERTETEGNGKLRVVSVERFGAIREVMRGGKTEARVQLSDAVIRPHAFAVGALEKLAGEVTIIDGDVWVSRVAPDGGLTVAGPKPADGDGAALLAISHVARWHETPIESAATGAELERLIEQFARSNGIDTDKPFPFKIEGALSKLDLHVINGYCPIATDPATQDRKPWRHSTGGPTKVVIIGFYAANRVGVMTHHGTSIHAHAMSTVAGKRIMGHVERVTVEPGMTLFVPKE